MNIADVFKPFVLQLRDAVQFAGVELREGDEMEVVVVFKRRDDRDRIKWRLMADLQQSDFSLGDVTTPAIDRLKLYATPVRVVAVERHQCGSATVEIYK